MAASFIAASTQSLNKAASSVSAAPFTMAAWFYPASAGTQLIIWCIEDAGDTDGWGLVRATGNDVIFGCFGGGSSADLSVGSGVSDNWYFVVARAISSTNRRVALLNPNGSISHGQNTTSKTPANVALEAIGAFPLGADYFNGRISHFWLTNTDIQPGGGQLDNALVHQLARYGPLSVPHVRNSLIEYLPLERSLLGDKGDYYSARGRKIWTNTNGVTLTD